jgi:hypothetical protein
MNKKGSGIFVGFMIMMAMIVLTFGMSPMVKEIIDQTRNSSNMDCDNSSISDFDKVACVTIDMGMFYFIAGLITLALAVFVSRRFK